MMRVKAAGLAMAALALQAQTPTAPSAQQLYDAGQAAADKGDWATAATSYRAALAGMNPKGRSAAVIRSRLATALFAVRDNTGARATATAAVAQFAALGVTADGDLAAAHATLGDLARFGGDDPAAIAAYRDAIAAAAGPDRDRQLDAARAGLAMAAMTSDPPAAARALDDALAAPGFAASPKTRQANLLTLRARAELNRGDPKAAKGFIDRALDLAGRTTTRVNMAQVAMRGDAALIYAKLGDTDEVRKLLTYSGAGHLPDNGWLIRGEGDLPLCGDGIAPEDVAVVEFAVNDSGRPIGAAAVYASKPGPLGDTFADAVRHWRWAPATVSKLDVFWRSAVRIELRCVTRPRGVALAEPFRDAAQDWFAAHGIVLDPTDPALKPEPFAAAPGPAGRAARALAAIRAAATQDKATAPRAELSAALDESDAPTDARAFLLLTNAAPDRPALPAITASLTGQPGAERALAWLRVSQALGDEARGHLIDARAALAAAVALPPAALPADDPVRIVALLHLSLIDKRQGKAAAADARLIAAGVSADQCSLLDVQPMTTNARISSAAFPAEAMRWGFEGTVREAFDINADGSVAGVRTVIAYPPLVFGPATERAVRGFRYAIPTLGDRPIGCAAQTVNVRYVLPH